MSGIIISYSDYSYEGDIYNNEPHGNGVFKYSNNDQYIGECKHGRMDGYGKYIYSNGSTYTGFFSYGKINGIGTYEDENNIYKGTWRNGRKHGKFYKTKKNNQHTYVQNWRKGNLISSHHTQYVPSVNLQTTKNKLKTTRKEFKGVFKHCNVCYTNYINAVNDRCGHVVMCDQCYDKCEQCPICRCPIGNVIKLYIS